jgi:hypothetical protein
VTVKTWLAAATRINPCIQLSLHLCHRSSGYRRE